MPIIHSEKWVIAEGDPNQWAVGITKATFDRIMRDSGTRQADALALYVFYAVTARWQHTSTPQATNKYVAKGLGWGESKVIAIRKVLLGLGLIEAVVMRSDSGRVRKDGWLVRVNYVVGRMDYAGNVYNFDQNVLSQGLVNSRPKEELLISGKEELLIEKEIHKEKRFKKPTKEELALYAKQIGFQPFNPQDFLDYYEARGWMMRGTAMKNWQAAVRTWKNRPRASYGSGPRVVTKTPRELEKERQLDKMMAEGDAQLSKSKQKNQKDT